MIELVSKLFFIVNPIGNIPLLAVLLKDLAPKDRPKVIITEVIAASVIMLLFYFCGKPILDGLGIGGIAVRVAGALLLGKVGIQMIFPSGSGLGSMFGLKPGEKPFLIPIAMPSLAGPGVLANLMSFAEQPGLQRSEMTGAILIVSLITLIVLLAAPFIIKNVSTNAMSAVEKIMGLVLLMMAAEMMIGSASEALIKVLNSFNTCTETVIMQV